MTSRASVETEEPRGSAVRFVAGALLLLLVATAGGLLAGCAAAHDYKRAKDFRRQSPPNWVGDEPAPSVSDRRLEGVSGEGQGSLWSANERENFLFADDKARKVNDLITIQIVETASAAKNATTDLQRESSVEAAVPQFFGIPAAVERANEKNKVTFSSLVDASLNSEFAGKGAMVRTDNLTSSMTAMVVEVLPNGNLVIEGKRIVGLGEESQTMFLRGVVRPADIGPDNTVLSTYIANAEICYSGSGAISDEQRPGWGRKIFNTLWPL
jgi:flagellar L-ring protein precursor FlgH